MKINIVALGKHLDKNHQIILNNYLKRLPKEFQLKFISHQGTKANPSSSQTVIQEKDSQILQNLIPVPSFKIALDENGTQLSSVEFSKKLADWQMRQKELSFIIGGAYGLAPKFVEQCNFCWSLSKLTLPHQLVRVILVEQIYRAWTLLKKHPYHK